MKRLAVVGFLLVVGCGDVVEPAGPSSHMLLIGAGTYRLSAVNDKAIPASRPTFGSAVVDSGGLVVTADGGWVEIEFAHAPGVGIWAAYWGGFIQPTATALNFVDSTRTMRHFTGTVDDTSIVLVDNGQVRWRYVRSANAPQPSAYIRKPWVAMRRSIGVPVFR